MADTKQQTEGAAAYALRIRKQVSSIEVPEESSEQPGK